MPELYLGDCLEILRGLPSSSVDSIVTDPPAGISFMGKEWDHHKGGRDAWIAWMAEIALECRRVLKPGAHALVWALPRTSHWTATAWENAGFDPRECVHHAFGSGFPKNHDISKAIDKHLGLEREVFLRRGTRKKTGETKCAQADRASEFKYSHPASDEARRWSGWGTALKPAVEHWWLLRSPLAEKTIAQNVLRHGVGGINIDGGRVGESGGCKASPDSRGEDVGAVNAYRGRLNGMRSPQRDGLGRWPASLVHDGSEDVRDCFLGDQWEYFAQLPDSDEEDHTARSLLYVPKTLRKDREEGCDSLSQKRTAKLQGGDSDREELDPVSARFRTQPSRNNHPTVKPTALMRYLCRLITPPNGIVLDPFMGSGSTGKAAMLEGFRFVGVEKESEYFEIARARIEHAASQKERKEDHV